MRLTLLQGPAAEPLELDDVKAHLRIDGDTDDTLLGSLIATSRMHVEAALGLALITQTWRWHSDCWPAQGVVELMKRPLRSVEQIVVKDGEGVPTVVAAANYVVDVAGGRVKHRSGAWPEPGVPIAGIEIDFTAGFGDAGTDVAELIRQALRLLVAHWYEVRSPVMVGSMATRVPDTVSALLMPYRGLRL